MPTKTKHTAQLRHRVASTRRISVSARARLPAREGFRSSLGEGGFFNLRVLIGLFIVVAGVSLALLGSGVSSPSGARDESGSVSASSHLLIFHERRMEATSHESQ